MRTETRTLSEALYNLAEATADSDAKGLLNDAAERLDHQTIVIAGMSMVMLDAAKEITRFADELKAASTIGGEWDGSDRAAKEEYDRLMELASMLMGKANA